MKILGVDIGSRTLALGLLVADEGDIDLIDSTSIKARKHWPPERRYKYIDDELKRILTFPEHGGWSPDVMACEEPWSIVGRMRANNALWRVVGHCECMANRLGMDFRLVRIHDWRRTSGIKGRKREEVKAAAIQAAKTIFRKTLPEDEAEAVLIARHLALTMR